MEIETKRLMLRNYLEEDWKTVHEYASEYEFSKYQIWGPNTVEETKAFISYVCEEAMGVRNTRCIDTSRMSREVHVRICEKLRGKFPRLTRRILELIW
jgi:hypothetical protein